MHVPTWPSRRGRRRRLLEVELASSLPAVRVPARK